MSFGWLLLCFFLHGNLFAIGHTKRKKNKSTFTWLEQYVKLPTRKASHHKMKNVDFIYIINLDQRPEKFESCIQQLSPYYIHPYRFSAVNGWELSLKTINELGVSYKPWMKKGIWGTSYLPDGNWEAHHEVMHTKDRSYFCHCMARGTIGIVLSHLSVLKDAYDAGYETIWVMEDDIQVIQSPHKIPLLIEKLDGLVKKKRIPGWDILFTDQDTKDRDGHYVRCRAYAQRPNFTPANPARFLMRQSVGSTFTKLGARYGTYSMIIRRSGMKKILDFFNQYHIFLPYDMDFNMPEDLQLFAVKNDVVSTQPQALSDNGVPGYLHRSLLHEASVATFDSDQDVSDA